MRTTNKDYKGDIKTFGAVLALRYKKIDLNKSFDGSQEKLIKYMIKELNNAEDVLVLIQYLVYPKYSFDAKN